MSELIELDLSEQEIESYIKNYVIDNMIPESYEQYSDILLQTDSVAEAIKAAVLNEYINKAVAIKTAKLLDTC